MQIFKLKNLNSPTKSAADRYEKLDKRKPNQNCEKPDMDNKDNPDNMRANGMDDSEDLALNMKKPGN